jgi:hypothetical protein
MTNAAQHPQVIDYDLACNGCGYNLRGLAIDGNCPECACRITFSVSDNKFTGVDEGRLKPIMRGARSTGITNALIVITTLFASIPPYPRVGDALFVGVALLIVWRTLSVWRWTGAIFLVNSQSSRIAWLCRGCASCGLVLAVIISGTVTRVLTTSSNGEALSIAILLFVMAAGEPIQHLCMSMLARAIPELRLANWSLNVARWQSWTLGVATVTGVYGVFLPHEPGAIIFTLWCGWGLSLIAFAIELLVGAQAYLDLADALRLAPR